MLVVNNIPDDSEFFNFYSDKQPINLSSKYDILELDNLGATYIDLNNVNIHFPFYNHFYKQTYILNNNITLIDICKLIYKTGYDAIKHDIIINPHKYSIKNAHQLLDNYVINGFYLYLNDVYVKLECIHIN